jgi:hypothetical protein
LAAENSSKPVALIIELRRQVFVLPWYRFVYAEGTQEQLKLQFASHSIAISGYGLAALLVPIAAQRVLRISEPSQNQAKFGVRGPDAEAHRGPGITEIVVEESE